MQQPVSSLSPVERARRYRELAAGLDATVKNMENIPSLEQLRAAYAKLARDWRALAIQAEHSELLPPQLANAAAAS